MRPHPAPVGRHNAGMKIAAVQMVSTPDWPANRDAAARLVAEAAAAGAQLVALPEYFCVMGRRDTDKLALAEPAGDGPIQRFLSDTAREHGLWLVGGTLPLRAGPAAGSAAADLARSINTCNTPCCHSPAITAISTSRNT